MILVGILKLILLSIAAILWTGMHDFVQVVNKNGGGMSPILCDHTPFM